MLICTCGSRSKSVMGRWGGQASSLPPSRKSTTPLEPRGPARSAAFGSEAQARRELTTKPSAGDNRLLLVCFGVLNLSCSLYEKVQYRMSPFFGADPLGHKYFSEGSEIEARGHTPYWITDYKFQIENLKSVIASEARIGWGLQGAVPWPAAEGLVPRGEARPRGPAPQR